MTTGTNTYNRYRQFGSHTFCKSSRYLFEYDGKAACLFEKMSITNQLFSFAVIFGTYRISTVFINGLRHQSQVSHHRNTRADDTFHRIDDFFSTFQFQSIGMAFLHNADGRSKTFHFVTLIRSERHIDYNHSAFYATYH